MKTYGFLVIAILLIWGALAPPGLARDEQPGDDESTLWELVRLDLDIAIMPQQSRLRGTATALLRLTADSSYGPTMEIRSIGRFLDGHTGDNHEVVIDESQELARVRYDQPLPAGTEITVILNFGRRKNSNYFVVGPRVAYSSWNSGWYPSPLQVSERAPGQTRLTMPVDWRGVSNGTLSAVSEENGLRTEIWDCERWLGRSFVAGPFSLSERQFGDQRLVLYDMREDPVRAESVLGLVAECLQAQTRLFGPFPFERYAIIALPTELIPTSAFTQCGFSLVDTAILDSADTYTPLLARHAAFARFGNYIVARRQAGMHMLSDALSQYGAVLAMAAISGEEAAREFMRFSRPGASDEYCARGFFTLEQQGYVKPLSGLTAGDDKSYAVSRAKGMWVYDMLRRRIGDQIFRDVVTGLGDRFADKSLTLDTLRAAFISATPDSLELAAFFEQWLDRSGVPELTASWETPSEESIAVRVRQQTDPYDLWLDIAVDGSSGNRMHRVHLRESDQTFTLPVSGTTTRVRLDPNHRLLLRLPEYEPKTYLAVAIVFMVGLFAGFSQAVIVGFRRGSFYGATDLPWGLLIGVVSAAVAYFAGWYGLILAIGLALVTLIARWPGTGPVRTVSR